MQPVPDDAIKNLNEDIEDEPDPEKRMSIRASEKRIDDESEYYENGGKDGERNEASFKRPQGSPGSGNPPSPTHKKAKIEDEAEENIPKEQVAAETPQPPTVEPSKDGEQ
jgi:hypothetical protein